MTLIFRQGWPTKECNRCNPNSSLVPRHMGKLCDECRLAHPHGVVVRGEPVIIDVEQRHRKPKSLFTATCGKCLKQMTLAGQHINDPHVQKAIADWSKIHFVCFGYPAPDTLLNGSEIYDAEMPHG